MNGISERIEDRCNFSRHRLAVTPDVAHRQRDVLGKCARAIYAHALCVGAQMPPARQAVSATSADYVSFTADDLARPKIINVRADLYNLADEFMADDEGNRNVLLSPAIP